MDEISMAKQLFNETWDLLDNSSKTDEEKALMLHKAHTSCYLWKSAEKPVNNARGEWQVSHVYSMLGYGEPALLHAKLSLEICLSNSIGDFDLAFGYEAVARACSVLGDFSGAKINKSLGLSACESIDKEEDREYAVKEINGIAVE